MKYLKLENLVGYKIAKGIEIYNNYACMDASIAEGNMGTYYPFDYIVNFFKDIEYTISDLIISEGEITRLYIEYVA